MNTIELHRQIKVIRNLSLLLVLLENSSAHNHLERLSFTHVPCFVLKVTDKNSKGKEQFFWYVYISNFNLVYRNLH